MDCASARRILMDAAGPAEPAGDLATAREHWRSCRGCQVWREREGSWRSALKGALPTINAPLAVKERVFAGLAQIRAGATLGRQRRTLFAAASALALLGLAAGGIWWRHEQTRAGLLVAALAEDHLLYAPNQTPAEFSSGDPEAVTRWFADRVDFAVAVPEISGAELLGGRLCTFADRRAALSLYKRGGKRLSLFQMPAQGLPFGPMRIMTVGSRQYRCGHRKGISVLAWINQDLLFALVSDLPEEEMLRIAGDAFDG